MARLGPRRHGHPRPAAVDGRHLDRAAQSSRRDRDRHPAIDIGAVALEDPVRRHADEDVKIACRGATNPDLAFTCESDANAILDAGRDVDRQGLFAPYAALAATRLAGIIDDPPGPLTAGAGPLDRKETLLHPHPPPPMAGRAGDRLRASLVSAALAL